MTWDVAYRIGLPGPFVTSNPGRIAGSGKGERRPLRGARETTP